MNNSQELLLTFKKFIFYMAQTLRLLDSDSGFDLVGYIGFNTTKQNFPLKCMRIKCINDASQVFFRDCSKARKIVVNAMSSEHAIAIAPDTSDGLICNEYLKDIDELGLLTEELLQFCGTPGEDNTMGKIGFNESDTTMQSVMQNLAKSSPVFQKDLCSKTNPSEYFLIGLGVTVLLIVTAVYLYRHHQLKNSGAVAASNQRSGHFDHDADGVRTSTKYGAISIRDGSGDVHSKLLSGDDERTGTTTVELDVITESGKSPSNRK